MKRSNAMACPKCGTTKSAVVDKRNTTEGVRRRRKCLSCNLRFTTYEMVGTAFPSRVTTTGGKRSTGAFLLEFKPV